MGCCGLAGQPQHQVQVFAAAVRSPSSMSIERQGGCRPPAARLDSQGAIELLPFAEAIASHHGMEMGLEAEVLPPPPPPAEAKTGLAPTQQASR